MTRQSPRRMVRPDDEAKPFVVRWHSLTRLLLVESSVKLVAWTAMDYADNDDGTDVYPSDARLARETGFSEQTIRKAWAVLRALEMADRVSDPVPYGKRPLAAKYHLQIPDNWLVLPILGPYCRPFTCVQCGAEFAPSTSAYRIRPDGSIGWFVDRMVFCPPPRKKSGRDAVACLALWEHEAGVRWDSLGREVWDLFREARGRGW